MPKVTSHAQPNSGTKRSSGALTVFETSRGLKSALFAGLACLGLSITPTLAQSTAPDANGKTETQSPKVVLPSGTSNPFDIPEVELPAETPFSAYQRGFYLTAFDLATKLAGKGDAAAQTLLGELYLNGQGVPQDSKEAASWFALAAEGGDREAQFSLGMLHVKGNGVERDLEQARTLFEKSAAKGQKSAQFNLAMMYLQGQIIRQDLNKALDLFTKSAKQGLPEAQYALAQLYVSDLFPTPNWDQSGYWMHEAAKAGFSDAQLEYGLMLFKGEGVTQDYKAARSWIERAAKAGNVLAQNRLARILARGFGDEPEPVKAAQYYLLSKRAGKSDDWLEGFFQTLSNGDKEKALKAISEQSVW